MTGAAPVILPPKIPSCGHLAQPKWPQGKAGLVVAGSWPSVESGEGGAEMRRVGTGVLNRHTVRLYTDKTEKDACT